ncbi:hypothetical protein GCM10011348_18680 [Marinobacterium nitratireducens]|uniref:Uncharacterized protein n=1 Tax=Marinobacterium nitratireducens TaxID=518897 RepID=A0A918DRS7_9GAMM|nr:hypothetical protein [Marinobacterium nitratireducens]GGO80906.1 hypothetical protein GCM10011348_18680 [Marinobacterium nitratireducens]
MNLTDKPSLEALVESGVLPLDSLHPGGLGLTRELVELCGIKLSRLRRLNQAVDESQRLPGAFHETCFGRQLCCFVGSARWQPETGILSP